MATSALDLVVITPERQVLQSAAEAVVIPAHDGELGILHDRAPLMCELGIGQLRYTQQGQTRRLFIDGGFAQVVDNRVTVLTGRALPAEQVSADVVAAFEQAVGTHQGYDADTRAARELAQRRVYALRGLHAAV
jgi:F-type H+-transporting ATPase subunit epsilon